MPSSQFDFSISTDKSTLDLPMIHQFLSSSYWAADRTSEQIVTSIENSVTFGLYASGSQIGFARVVTDFVAIAYLMDVFILPQYRNNGLGTRLVEHILSFPDFSTVSKWMLRTVDAKQLYERLGFVEIKTAEGTMVRSNYEGESERA